jgi:hypothetical protein
MTTKDQDARPILALEPGGAERSPHMIGTLAQSGGTLTGAIVSGAVRTWLADSNGQLTLVMWPADFRARFDPLEVIDAHGEVIARGGRLVTVGGGYLKSADPGSLGHELVFSAWQASDVHHASMPTVSD